jgi:hypothetical protein
VGVLDGAELSAPETGTAQGSVLSPLLGNVTLHYALDLWFETEAKPRLRGRASLIRWADDFVIGFEHEEDARRVRAVLGKRLGRFGLTLHPDKTRLLPFRRPPAGQKSGKGSASFDFLGFTLYWVRSLKGRWGMACKTRRASLRRAIQSVTGWCRLHRHLPVKAQHAALTRRIQGHFNYFGVSGNFRSLLLVNEQAKRSGTSGSAVGASASVSPGSGSRICSATSRSRVPGSRSGSGARSHEPPSRRSRMVEMTLWIESSKGPSGSVP